MESFESNGTGDMAQWADTLKLNLSFGVNYTGQPKKNHPLVELLRKL